MPSKTIYHKITFSFKVDWAYASIVSGRKNLQSLFPDTFQKLNSRRWLSRSEILDGATSNRFTLFRLRRNFAGASHGSALHCRSVIIDGRDAAAVVRVEVDVHRPLDILLFVIPGMSDLIWPKFITLLEEPIIDFKFKQDLYHLLGLRLIDIKVY